MKEISKKSSFIFYTFYDKIERKEHKQYKNSGTFDLIFVKLYSSMPASMHGSNSQ